jgi:His-Xaa-Ser system radical SAM maturase HxsB
MKKLPFRYGSIGDSMVLTNESGQYYFLSPPLFKQFISDSDSLPQTIKDDLQSKFFLAEDDSLAQALEASALKLRTKKAFLATFTELHIIVLTYACNSKCIYCHASSSTEATQAHSLSIPTARRICEFIMHSPAPSLKIEFQGGEPTLQFDTMVFIVEYLKTLNTRYRKTLEFVVCTNLLFLPPSHLQFYKKHDFSISTSLDGPRHIHDKNRTPFNTRSNYDRMLENYHTICTAYSPNRVSALLTVSKHSLSSLKECVDTYVEQGFRSIFIRALNPYGVAEKALDDLGYPLDDFLTAYDEVLDYLIALNKQGTFIREELASIFLQKMLTPFPSGFVDIQSPPGTGISCAVYDADGGIYPSDEARMLARCGDTTFWLGSVLSSTYEEVFLGEKLRELIRMNMVEASAHCCGCPYVPYCGIDPVRTYQETNLHTPNQSCKKYAHIITRLFEKLHADEACERVFFSWLTGIPYQELTL